MKTYFLGIFFISLGLGLVFFLSSHPIESLPETTAQEEVAQIPPVAPTDEVSLRHRIAVADVLAQEKLAAISASKGRSPSSVRRIPAKKTDSENWTSVLKRQSRVTPKAFKKIGTKKYKVTKIVFSNEEMRENSEQKEVNPDLVRAAYARQRNISSIDDQIVDTSDTN